MKRPFRVATMSAAELLRLGRACDRAPGPGGWNRFHFVVEDIEAEVARLRAAGVRFRNEIISGPGGKQIVLDDPSGNPIELFQPARL
jgi:catechol 2,3-dioxygenase-like lactoylglutathione lyase family enzyme